MRRYLNGLSLAVAVMSAVVLSGCAEEGGTDDTPLKQATVEQDGPNHNGQIVKVLGPWVRANPVPGRPSAAFFDVENGAADDDRLVGVSLPEGGRAELHTHKHEDGIMHMLRMDGVNVPARGGVSFRPGSHHVMLFDVPSTPIGGHLTLVLHFEEAGEIEILAEIQPITATGVSEGSEKP